MALVHHLYVGHFIPEQGYVRFEGHKPAVARPIDMLTVRALLKSYLGDTIPANEAPSAWAMSILPDYIICDHFGSPAEALRYCADYAERSGAVMLDLGSFSLLTPAQVRKSAAVRTASAPGVETAARWGA
jgi:hypothetical protein